MNIEIHQEVTLSELMRLGLPVTEASRLLNTVERVRELAPADQWRALSADTLKPSVPFPVHQLMFGRIFSRWDSSGGPAPAWLPDELTICRSNIGQMMEEYGFACYEDLHRWSVSNRDAFWSAVIRRLGIRFEKEPLKIRDLDSPHEAPVWLPGALFNIAENCFNGSPDAPTLVFPGSNDTVATMSVRALQELSARVAKGLRDIGMNTGDAVAVIMPMTVESVAIYLGIVLAGCVVVSISDSFAAEQIRKRCAATDVKLVFTQDVVSRSGKRIPLYARFLEAPAPRMVVVESKPGGEMNALRPDDMRWAEFLAAENVFAPVMLGPDRPSNYLFSSGTTGEPKVIPWSHTTPIKCAADAMLHHDIQEGDILAWPTNLGWMMGPWLVYAALANRATIALFPDAPTTREFGRFVENAGVTMLGVVPSLVRSWRESRCMEGLDWSRIKKFSSSGECSNPEDMLYLMMLAGYKPIIEYCGGTEIGGGFLTGTVVQAAAPGYFSTPALGMEIDIVDENSNPAHLGEVLLVPPSIGLSDKLLNADNWEVYFKGVPSRADGSVRRRHGDEVEVVGGGYFRHHGRTDDTMNLGGIKVSAAEIESSILANCPSIREAAAIAVPQDGGGPDCLVLFLVPSIDEEMEVGHWPGVVQSSLREHLNPLFRVADVVVVSELPRTESNKVMRRTLRSMYHRTVSDT